MGWSDLPWLSPVPLATLSMESSLAGEQYILGAAAAAAPCGPPRNVIRRVDDVQGSCLKPIGSLCGTSIYLHIPEKSTRCR